MTNKDIIYVLGKAVEVSHDPQWIPVTERLPEDGVAVLVTLKWSDEDYEVAQFEYLSYYGGWGKKFNDKVIAWMPLPEPYRERNE